MNDFGPGEDPGFAKGEGADQGEHVERKLITGVWRQSPGGVQGQSPLWEVRGAFRVFIQKGPKVKYLN